ncbi:hypothetical protein NDU88_002791 [Pleurodeles waltl]|uniref:Uncharacterized protein n=1 Tax=Pleurodeles waltl TaxID=8319 RepID=A0AAV7M3I8_PLEWA|nr:hypothetical protein NDU88_002791 [Pleurodeles waltl]
MEPDDRTRSTGPVPLTAGLWSGCQGGVPMRGTMSARPNEVTVDVTLFRAGLKKVAKKVTNPDKDIARLQSTSKRLEDQLQFLTEEHERTVERLEDQEGRARRNNIRVVRVPKGVEGLSKELFLETLITDSLHAMLCDVARGKGAWEGLQERETGAVNRLGREGLLHGRTDDSYP